jgi:glycosyltransferase involved in cell wall biosynthesis
MNTFPLVSICLPAYNADKYINEALDCLLSQSYKNIEIIVVNDGSTDGTSEVLNPYKSKGVKIIEQENKGQCAAVNRAYSEATGEYIKFFDADDILSQDFIKNQVEILAGSSDTIASASWGRFYNNDINTFKLVQEPVYHDMEPIEWLVKAMWQRQAMMQCALWLIPRHVINRAGLWDERLSLINDFEFFIRVLLNSKEIRYAADSILYYRSGVKSSLSALNDRKGAESAYNSILVGTSTMINFENSARIKKIAANCWQGFIYDFYPKHKDLLSSAEEKIKESGISTDLYKVGGYSKWLFKLIGWKATKKLKNFLNLK